MVIILQLYNKIFLILVKITKKSILENSKRNFQELIQEYNEGMYEYIQNEAMMYEHLGKIICDKRSKDK